MGENSSSFSPPGENWTPPELSAVAALLDGYEIQSLIGVGGMGAVYRATEIRLEREVAIKLLPITSLGDDEMNFADRFRHEARSMAKLNHPAVVAVYDFGEAGSTEENNAFLYLVLEFVEGSDVHQYVEAQGGSIPPEHAHAIASHVLDGLAAAHAHGLIHRDIKPANILLDSEGRVKIADFGLAKQTDTKERSLTKTNLAMGTPDYVAPEALITGTIVDQRADLYAVGAMLYVMITGQVPRGMFKPASALVPGLDKRFDAIIARALQSDPKDRYPDPTSFRTDLDAILTTPRADSAQNTTALAIAHKRAPKLVVGAGAVRQARSRRTPSSPAEKSYGGLILLGLAGILCAALAYFTLGGEGGSKEKQDQAGSPKRTSQGGSKPAANATSQKGENRSPKAKPARMNPVPTKPWASSQGPIPEGAIDLLSEARVGAPGHDWIASKDQQGGITGPLSKNNTTIDFPNEASLPYRVEVDLTRHGEDPGWINFTLPLDTGTVSIGIDWSGVNARFLINDEERTEHAITLEPETRRTLTFDVLPGRQGLQEEAGPRLVCHLDRALFFKSPDDEDISEPQSANFQIQTIQPGRLTLHRVLLISDIPEDSPLLNSLPPSESDPKSSTMTGPSSDLLGIPEYASLREGYEAAMRRNSVEIVALASNYTKALQGAVEGAKSSGDLATYNAFKAETVAVENLVTDESSRLEELTSTAPAHLRSLRSTWTESFAPLSLKGDGLRRAYRGRLDELITDLTKGGRIDEANLILSYRQGMEDLPPPAVAPSAAIVSKAVQLDPKVAEAKKEGGRLNLILLDFKGEEIDLGDTKSLTRKRDWTRISVTSQVLFVARARGDAIMLRYQDDRWTHGEELEDLLLNQEGLYAFEGGAVVTDLTRPAETKWSKVTLINPISLTRIAAGTSGALVLDQSGSAEVSTASAQAPSVVLPPAAWFQGASKISAAYGSSVLAALYEDGTIAEWNLKAGTPIANAAFAEGVRDINGTGEELLVLTKGGRVLQLYGSGTLLPPADAGPVVAMRYSTANSATYQRPDGTWFGVGFSPATTTLIQNIGVALDLVALEPGGGQLRLAWITP